MNYRVLWILLSFMTIDATKMFPRECDDQLTGPVGVLHLTDPYVSLKSWKFFCEYNVTVAEEKTINVQIPAMSISSVDNECNDSYILLRDGPSQYAPLLGSGKYCGNTSVGPLLTSGNQLHIRTAIELGHNAQYNLLYQENPLSCGGIFQLSAENPQQTFTSPNYPNGSSFSECTWVFTAPVGYVMSMNFTQLSFSPATDCDDEYTEVRNGGTSLSPLISKMCFNNEAEITTTENLLYVKFYSNLEQPMIALQAVVTATEDTCGQIIKAENGSITSPHYPFTSPSKICTWEIIVPRNKRIELTFHDLHMSDAPNCKQSNHISISEQVLGNSTEVLLGTYCGVTKPGVIKTSCNKAFIRFNTNYRNIGHFRGFVLNFTAIDEPCKFNCGRVLRSSQGFISSPNYISEDPSMQNCLWEIIVPPQKRIKFEFLKVMINDNAPCKESYLQINEDFNGTAKTYCGSTTPAPILTSGSTAKVFFHSNETSEDSGFLLTYSAVDPSPYSSEPCYEEFREPIGVITSPNYPEKSPSPFNCTYKIIQPPGFIIQFKITNLRPNRSSTYLRLSDDYGVLGRGGKRGTIRVAGNENIMSYLPTNSSVNIMTLEFIAGVHGQESAGFSVFYKVFNTGCGGLLTNTSGTIQSPNFPNDYRSEENCRWVLQAPPGHVVILTWTHFHMKAERDTIYITETRNTDNFALIAAYGGTKLPPSVITRSRTTRIYFRSTNKYRGKNFAENGSNVTGFSFNYRFVDLSVFGEMDYNFTSPTV